MVDGDRAFFSGSLAGGKGHSRARVPPGELTMGAAQWERMWGTGARAKIDGRPEKRHPGMQGVVDAQGCLVTSWG